MPNPRKYCKTVEINLNLFAFVGYQENSKNNNTLIMYCNKTKTWSSKVQLRLDDNYFCVCSFKKNLYVIHETGKCFIYNPKSDKRFQLAEQEKKVFQQRVQFSKVKLLLLEV